MLAKQPYKDANTLKLDRTLFSRADENYQQDVQHLSQIDSYQELSQKELLDFCLEYGLTAFTCPIRSCKRFRFGYDSAAKLEDYKKARYGKALKCYRESCAYNDVGYASPRSLRDHQRRHHSKPELRRVPNFIRRPVRNDSQKFSTQSAGQAGQQAQLNAQAQQETASSTFEDILMDTGHDFGGMDGLGEDTFNDLIVNRVEPFDLMEHADFDAAYFGLDNTD
ncbi:hypothetical protein AUP68_04134 [Ilyonectria robusta]